MNEYGDFLASAQADISLSLCLQNRLANAMILTNKYIPTHFIWRM
jgi:hypothetical protein